jgi:hypothetical protein
MQAAKALAVSIVAATLVVTPPSRALAPSLAATSDNLNASIPAPEPRDLALLVMSLAAIALAGRRSK